MLYFPGFWPKIGRPQSSHSHHIPSHPHLTPSEILSELPTHVVHYWRDVFVMTCCLAGKSHPWTNTSVGGNFRRTFRTIGPYEFPQEKVRISPEISMDQWRSKFSESFSLDRYWSIECSSPVWEGCGALKCVCVCIRSQSS